MALAAAEELPRLRVSGAKRPLLRLWQKALLIAAFVWALAIVVPDVYRLYWPLGSLGFSADNAGRIYDVYDLPANAVGLNPGDHITLKPAACLPPNSDKCRNFLAVFGGMGGLAYVRDGAVVDLPITRAGGGTENIRLRAVSEPLGPWARFLLALDEIAAVFVLWRAFRLVWDRFSAMTLGVFLYVMWFNPGQYFTFYAWLQGHPVGLLAQESLQALSQGAGYAGFLIFALRFPRGETEPQFRSLESVAFVLGVALALLQIMSFGVVFGFQTEWVTRAALGGGYAVAFFGFWIVARRRKLQTPLDYQRMRWVFWGCLIGIPAFVFAELNEATSWLDPLWNLPFWNNWSPTEAVNEACYLLSGVFAIFICEAVRHPRIGNVSYELRHLAIAGVVVVIFAAIEISMENSLDHMLSLAGLAERWQFPSEVAAVVLIGAASDRGARAIDRLFSRDLRHAISDCEAAGHCAKDVSKLEDVDAILLNAPADALHLASAVVYREIDGTYRVVGSRPASDGMRPEFLHELDQIFLQKLEPGRPVRLGLRSSEIDTDAAIAAPTIAVPVMIGGKIEAIAIYGAHVTGDDLAAPEIRALENFAEQIALAYDAARISALEREIETLRRQLASGAQI